MNVINSFNKFAEQYADFTFDNILQFELNKFISLVPEESKILDLGCGCGRDVQYFIEYKFDVFGIDASEKIIEEARKRVEGKFKIMDINNLSFEENSFDGIWAQDSISYLSKGNIGEVFRKIFNILNENGVFFISVREGEDEKLIEHEKLGKNEIMISFFNKEELEKFLEKAGFEILNSYVQEGEDFKWVNVFAKKN
ncbi:MAG: hypothetical protein CMH64_02790 [Nanoarchaeota archaeon]|nr:hypothetical protein [Nanoarchaeota archaeon]|tara:strand:+ start:337 stop:927 length:591 start_codon:yes stop_codon:yes gene_type:complete